MGSFLSSCLLSFCQSNDTFLRTCCYKHTLLVIDTSKRSATLVIGARTIKCMVQPDNSSLNKLININYDHAYHSSARVGTWNQMEWSKLAIIPIPLLPIIPLALTADIKIPLSDAYAMAHACNLGSLSGNLSRVLNHCPYCIHNQSQCYQKYDLNYLVFKWFHVARKKLFTISIVDISVFNWCNLIGMLVYLPCARFKQIRMFQLTVSIKFL